MSEKTLVETLKEDRIRIGAWTPTLRYDEAHIKMVAEAGIDFAIICLDDMKRELQENIFKWFAKYGIEACLHEAAHKRTYLQAGMFDGTNIDKMWYKDEPAFTHFLFVDEPGTAHYDEIKKSLDEFRALCPGKKAYINLLPMYANGQQLAGGAWKAPIEYFDTENNTYQNYLDEYVKKIDTDYICVDIYPCHRAVDPERADRFPVDYLRTTYEDYVKSIEIVAETCRKTGRDFWCYMQTCSWSISVREPDEADLRWQAYTLLSFGVKNLLCYTFAPNGGKTGCPLDKRSDKTELYLAYRRLCNGLHKLSDVYVTYKYVGAFNVNSSPETTPYLEMYNPYKDFKAITDIKCDSPLLVGCFEKKEGEGCAFTLVNMQDMQYPKTISAKLKITGNVTMYRDGVPTKCSSCDGWYEFTLVQGDGIFVTVD